MLAAGLTLELSTDVGDLVGFVLGGRILRSKLVRFLQNATWDCCSGGAFTTLLNIYDGVFWENS